MNKSIKKNYVLNLIYELFALLFPVFVMPYISRVLKAEGVGIYSYTYSIVYYFIILGALGFTTYARRELAKQRDNFECQKRIFWEITILKIVSSILSILLYEIIIFYFFGATKYFIFLQANVIYLIGTAFDIIYYFQGNEDFDKIVIKNIFIKLIGFATIFVFIHNSNDIYKYIIIQALIFLLSNISLWLVLPKKIFDINFKTLKYKEHLIPTLKLFIPTVASSIYTILDKTILGSIINANMSNNGLNFSADAEVGTYEQVEKLIRMLITVLTSLSVIVSSRTSFYHEKKDIKSIKKLIYMSVSYVLMLSIPMFFGIMEISNIFCPLFFGTGFEKAPILMNILAILVILIGLSSIFGMQYLTSIGEDNKYIISVIIGAIINVIANLFLIPKYYSYGAAIATVIAEFIILILLMYFSKNVLSFKQFLKKFLTYLVGALIMYLFSFSINYTSPIKTLVFKVFSSILIYLIYLILIKDEILLNIYKSLIRFKNNIKEKIK